MASETELKYTPPCDFLADAMFESEYILPYRGEIRKIDMHTDYLDTPFGDAAKQGITLRRRFEDGVSVVYAKCGRKSDGEALTVRGEWSVASENISVAAELLAAQGAPTESLRGLPLDICASVSFIRYECEVAVYDGFSFMLSYDKGYFGGKVPFSEIELELTNGTVSELVAFGRKLAEKFGLVPQPLSKYARAMKEN